MDSLYNESSDQEEVDNINEIKYRVKSYNLQSDKWKRAPKNEDFRKEKVLRYRYKTQKWKNRLRKLCSGGDNNHYDNRTEKTTDAT